jgi:hypothetical protein
LKELRESTSSLALVCLNLAGANASRTRRGP